MFTKEQLKEIAEDLAQEIAEQSLIDYANIEWLTHAEGENFIKVVKAKALSKILDAFGGFAE